MTANRSSIEFNPTAETILGFARSREDPQVLLGFDPDDYTFIQVDYANPSDAAGYSSEVWPFDSHEAALAVFLDLRNRMADARRSRTFRHQLEELQVSGRCEAQVHNHGAHARCSSFYLVLGKPLKVTVAVTVSPDRTMKDQKSLERLVEAVEQFIRTEGL